MTVFALYKYYMVGGAFEKIYYSEPKAYQYANDTYGPQEFHPSNWIVIPYEMSDSYTFAMRVTGWWRSICQKLCPKKDS